MQSHEEKERLVIESKAFKDLTEPVISAGGEILQYFLNTENLTLSDTGFIKMHSDNPPGMISHVHELERQTPRFRRVIDDLAEMVEPLLSRSNGPVAVAGGQRRDWIFSGLVARRLFIPHIALFKDGRVELYNFDGSRRRGSLEGYEAVPVSDLVTKASSAYDVRANPPTGWIVNLQREGVTVQNYVAVIDRLQRGREALEQTSLHFQTWF